MARFDTLEDYGEVNARGKSAKIKVRRVDMGDGLEVLDIRRFEQNDRFTGFTQKGVQIPLDQVSAFKNIIARIAASS